MPQWLRLIIAIAFVSLVLVLGIWKLVGCPGPKPAPSVTDTSSTTQGKDYQVTAVINAPPTVTLEVTLRENGSNPVSQTIPGSGSLDFKGTCDEGTELTIEAAPWSHGTSVDISPAGPQPVSRNNGSVEFQATLRAPEPPPPAVDSSPPPARPQPAIPAAQPTPAETPIEVPVERSVRVTVTANGTPAAGAEVDPGESGAKALTGGDGVAELTLTGLPSATVTLTVSYMGDHKETSVRLARTSPSAAVDFARETPYRVQVIRGGQPLAGITVKSTPGGGQAVTDAAGEAVISLRLPRETPIRFAAVVDGSEYTATTRQGNTPTPEPIVITVDNTISVEYVFRAAKIANAASGSRKTPLQGVEIIARDASKARLGDGLTDARGVAKVRVKAAPGTMISWDPTTPASLPSDYRPETPEWETVPHHANPDERELVWVQPEAPTGACCRPDQTCVVGDEKSCVAKNGTYKGDGTPCRPDLCMPPKPDLIPSPGSADPTSSDRTLFTRMDRATEAGWNCAFRLLRCPPGPLGDRATCRTGIEQDIASLRGEARSIQSESIRSAPAKVRAYLLLMLSFAVEGKVSDCDAAYEQVQTLTYAKDFEPVALLYRALARAIAGVTSPDTQYNQAIQQLEQAEQFQDPDDKWVVWQKQNYVKGVRALLIYWYCQEQESPASCSGPACGFIETWQRQCASDPDCQDNNTIGELKRIVCAP